MLLSSLLVSEQELELIRGIKEVNYGEMYGVDIPEFPPNIKTKVSDPVRSLIEWMRDGNQYIDILHVHQGEPVYAEINQKVGKFKCLVKTKFPTQ